MRINVLDEPATVWADNSTAGPAPCDIPDDTSTIEVNVNDADSQNQCLYFRTNSEKSLTFRRTAGSWWMKSEKTSDERLVSIDAADNPEQLQFIDATSLHECVRVYMRGPVHEEYFSRLNAATALDVILYYAVGADLAKVTSLRNMKYLHLKQCITLKSTEELGQAKSLLELEISHCGIDRFSGCAELPSLRALSIFNCREMTSILGLPNSLKTLSVLSCPMLSDIDAVFQVKGLADVYLSTISQSKISPEAVAKVQKLFGT